MSERGLLLALQRLHDDPGFVDQVAADPEHTLGIYDLDETECQTLIQAVTNKDDSTLRDMASKAGLDWTADHIQGVGAPPAEAGTGRTRRGVSTTGDLNLPAFGADWVTGSTQSSGSDPKDLAKDIHTGSPIKPAGG